MSQLLHSRVKYVMRDHGVDRYMIYDIGSAGDESFHHQFSDDVAWYPFKPSKSEVAVARKLRDLGQSGWHIRLKLDTVAPPNPFRNVSEFLGDETLDLGGAPIAA